MDTAAIPNRLQAARDKLEAKDLDGAVAIYDQVLAEAGDRPDILVRISGDLGSFGHVRPIIELLAPRYVAERHGPAAGINLLQAYIAVRDPDSAQHILDVLFALNRPELEERLYGFSNAISDLLLSASLPGEADAVPPPSPLGEAPVQRRAALISISKPVWFYGLEPLADQILPPKQGRMRRVAFAQLALPGAYGDFAEAMSRPEDEAARLSRALPAWLAETFFFSPVYLSSFALACWEEGVKGQSGNTRIPMVFGDEWGIETLRQLVETTPEGLDYIFTGSLRQRSGDYEALFRVWEVKKFRERKQFLVRWTPATADEELTRLRETLCRFMEWQPYPEGSGIAFRPPPATRAWIESLGASIGLFLAEKGIWPKALLPPAGPLAAELAKLSPGSEVASLAWLTFARRAAALGLPLPPAPSLRRSPLVDAAEKLG